MKLIVAIIKPFQVGDVTAALAPLCINDAALSEVKGFGRQWGQPAIYRGSEYMVEYVPKVKIEVEVDDSMVPMVVERIQTAAYTGRIGDGKIFVFDLTPVKDVLRSDPVPNHLSGKLLFAEP